MTNRTESRIQSLQPNHTYQSKLTTRIDPGQQMAFGPDPRHKYPSDALVQHLIGNLNLEIESPDRRRIGEQVISRANNKPIRIVIDAAENTGSDTIPE